MGAKGLRSYPDEGSDAGAGAGAETATPPVDAELAFSSLGESLSHLTQGPFPLRVAQPLG